MLEQAMWIGLPFHDEMEEESGSLEVAFVADVRGERRRIGDDDDKDLDCP